MEYKEYEDSTTAEIQSERLIEIEKKLKKYEAQRMELLKNNYLKLYWVQTLLDLDLKIVRQFGEQNIFFIDKKMKKYEEQRIKLLGNNIRESGISYVQELLQLELNIAQLFNELHCYYNKSCNDNENEEN